MGHVRFDLYENEVKIAEYEPEELIDFLPYELIDWLKENKFPNLNESDVTIFELTNEQKYDESMPSVYCMILYKDNTYSFRADIW